MLCPQQEPQVLSGKAFFFSYHPERAHRTSRLFLMLFSVIFACKSWT